VSNQKLFLLGVPYLERDDASISINRRKAIALLAYLAVTQQSHSRDTLAALFWPEAEENLARGAVRRALSDLNKVLGQSWSQIEGETGGLRPDAGLWVDVEMFHALWVSCQTHDHPVGEVCADCFHRLTEAVTLYRDDFMAGFTLPDSPAFDEWQFFQTESLRRELALVLEKLIDLHIARNDFIVAIPHTRRWLALDPLHEPAHRQLMRLYSWSEQQAAALRQYQQCVRILSTELGMAPAEETTALYERIRDGQLKQADYRASTMALPSLARPRVRQHNLPPQTTPFVG
jgi:DNA-binding SARP family transcriptional activator